MPCSAARLIWPFTAARTCRRCLPDGLSIAGVLPREDPHDAVVLSQGRAVRGQGSGIRGQGRQNAVTNVEALREILGATPAIGTSSVRRVAQLIRLFPGAQFAPIRGNLDTRLRKLDAGDNAALVLAAAGLRRLGFQSRISFTLPATLCVPAPGQGIIAIEIRAGDEAVARRGVVDHRCGGMGRTDRGTCAGRSAGRRLSDSDRRARFARWRRLAWTCSRPSSHSTAVGSSMRRRGEPGRRRRHLARTWPDSC